MPSLLLNGEVVQEEWQLADADLAATEGALVSLAQLVAAGPAGVDGVFLRAEDDARALAPWVSQLKRVGIVFGSFMDGRGFSQARLLREELGYTGELAALGGYMQDQLLYLKRCGFDRFQLPMDCDVDSWRASLADFSEFYQAASDQPLPLFRRRAQRLA